MSLTIEQRTHATVTLRGKPRKGGPWVARITGVGGKYGLERSFLKGREPSYRKGSTVFELREPGWYESGPNPRLVYAVDERFALTTVHVRLIPEAVTGPAPGQPGAWAGDLCKCGRTVQRFTADGWPLCNDLRTGGLCAPDRKATA